MTFGSNTTSNDHFIWLIGLHKKSKVLFVGNGWESWQRALPNNDWSDTPYDTSNKRAPYDMVFYHCSCARTEQMLVDHFRILQLHLKATGGIVIVADNFYTFSRLKMLTAISSPEFLNKGIHIGIVGFRRAIKKAGLKRSQLFIPMPDFKNMEEVVAVKSCLLELSTYHHFFLRLMLLFRIYPLIATSYLSLHLSKPLISGKFLQTINQHFAFRRELAEPIILERFNLRTRGSMVLFLKSGPGGLPFILRVVAEPNIQTIVKRNHSFLVRLHRNASVPQKVKKFLPNPVNFFEYEDRNIFIETMLPGVPAWKVNFGPYRKKIHKEAIEFIYTLNLSTRTKTTLTPKVLDQLLNDDLKRLSSCNGVVPELVSNTATMLQGIRTVITGMETFLVFGHGDYGYGNILVEPNSGKLTGVIDWDTGRKKELVGVDIINLEIQKSRNENNSGFFPAFLDVARIVIQRHEIDKYGIYRCKFGIPLVMILPLLGFTLLRYMARAAQYPKVFVHEQADYQLAISLFKDIFPNHD